MPTRYIDIPILSEGLQKDVESELCKPTSLFDTKGFISHRGLLRKDWGLEEVPLVLDKIVEGTIVEVLQAVTSLTRSGAVVTATVTAHGYSDGNLVVIKGAVEADYNGVFVIGGITADTFTYTIPGTPTTPATGTIRCALVNGWNILNCGEVEEPTPSGYTDYIFATIASEARRFDATTLASIVADALSFAPDNGGMADYTNSLMYWNSPGAPASARIIKTDLALAEIAALTLTLLPSGTMIDSEIDLINNIGYIFDSVATPGVVDKINLTTFTEMSALILSFNHAIYGAIDPTSTYLYVVGGPNVPNSQTWVAKIVISTFTEVASLQLTPLITDADSHSKPAITSTALYVMIHDVSNELDVRICKIDLATFTVVKELQVPYSLETTSIVTDWAMTISASGDYLYFSVAENFAGVYQDLYIYKVDLTSFEIVNSRLIVGGTTITPISLVTYNGHLYLGVTLLDQWMVYKISNNLEVISSTIGNTAQNPIFL